MKYVIHYQNSNDILYLLYVFQDYKSIILDSNEFVFNVGADEFLFTRDRTKTGDVLIKASHSDWGKEHKEYDKIIYSFPGEPVPTQISDNDLLSFLDKGNMCLLNCNVNVKHPNLINEPMFNLFYFYYFQGYNYVNFYKFNLKTNLVGMYYAGKHISGRQIKPRLQITRKVQSILGDDLYTYQNNPTKLSHIIEPYTQLGFWEKNFTSSYTDFSTSVCSLVFETNAVNEDNILDSFIGSSNMREHTSEKTLKCILFSEAKIFTMLYSSKKLLKDLKDLGFWVFNFEFYDFDSTDIMEVRNSIFKATEYLKELKNQLGSDQLVYESLLEKYNSNLEKNTERLKMLINNCANSTHIISRIKDIK